MKAKVFLGITIRVIVLFGAAMLFTFIPELLRDFLGDTPHLCESYKVCNHGYNRSTVDWEWHWGTRHYWYVVMCVFLFFISLANLVWSVINIIQKNYPELK